ncbi:MAG: 4-hydroxy-tetrahydrodipicolinate synthase [Clostridia bacterium]|nr:4-hydroxy-tetrahydrodipicolinate synthase [Clostridia bacterium]MBO5670069.1 4-hydroxy-tetrahydrodipicolinate synthase [Clostridia bacterium]
MSKQIPFRGCATALITPFMAGKPQEIDEDAFAALVHRQADAGVDALVVAGTTGEAAALTCEEHTRLITLARTHAPSLPVIAGCGAPTTSRAIELTKAACQAGASAVLVVTPYYNKCSQEGLYRHYTAIADAAEVPVILYEVPSRTGLHVAPETCLRLSGHANIAALKDATGDLERAAWLNGAARNSLALYAGSDGTVVPMLSVGAQGVISVLSNLLPRTVCRMCRAWFSSDPAAACDLQCRCAPLVRMLFSEVNPIPVKSAMAALGYCSGEFRLPLCRAEEELAEEIVRAIRAFGEDA